MATKSTKTIPAERKPFYALAGAGDLAVAKLRDLQGDLQTELAKVPTRLQKVPAQLSRVPAELGKVPAQVQTLPTHATAARAAATGLYTELATRGEKAIKQLRTGRPAPRKTASGTTSARAS